MRAYLRYVFYVEVNDVFILLRKNKEGVGFICSLFVDRLDNVIIEINEIWYWI